MMNSAKLNDWMQVAASVGVILSLVFVGFQIQQSRDIAIADIYQQRAAMMIQVLQGTYPVENYEDALSKSLSDQPLTARENELLLFDQSTWFSYWENNHFQYQIGLLSEEHWVSSRNSMRDRLRRPIYQDLWEGQREQWRESFAHEVDNVLAEARAGQ
jgi:hypothetical protein